MSRFDAAPLIAFIATEETNYGIETDGRVSRCSVPEIASITGHSLKQVTAILDALYLSRDSSLGVSAIQKLEAHEKGTKSPN